MINSIEKESHGWFESIAESYSKCRPFYPNSIFEWVSKKAVNHRRCWDCACGNGQASRGLAQHFDRVDATDISPSQIAAAVNQSRVHYKVAEAEASKLPSSSIDVVVVAAAIHWLDINRFNCEVLRVVRPHGLMVWLGYDPLRCVPLSLQYWLDDLYRERLKNFWPSQHLHVDRRYMDLPFPGDSKSFPKGYSIKMEWSSKEVIGFIGTWSALRHSQHLGHNILPELKHELDGIWPKNEKKLTFELPLMGRWGYLRE